MTVRFEAVWRHLQCPRHAFYACCTCADEVHMPCTFTDALRVPNVRTHMACTKYNQ